MSGWKRGPLLFKSSVTLEVGEEEEKSLGLMGFLSVCLSDVFIKVLEICDSLCIGLCRPQEDAFGASVLGPVVIIIMIKDNGNLICLSPLLFSSPAFTF